MPPEPDEQTLQELFQAVKREDERRTPPFERVWAAAHAAAVAPQPAPAARLALGAAALGLASAAIIVVLMAPRRPIVSSRASAASIFAWRSPTQGLLRITGEELLKTVPRFNGLTRDLVFQGH